jgi:hypothetical protein
MRKLIFPLASLAVLLVVIILYAADHLDSPAVTGPSNTAKNFDITDVYAFQSPANAQNLVLVCNTQGLLSPTATGTAQFGDNVLYEFNIDKTGDNVEDMVIQCLIQNGKMRVYGPVDAGAAQKGLISTIATNGTITEANVTAYANSANPSIGTNANGIKVFAGPRDDPFFFDLARFREILAGTQTGFRSPGVDTFAGTNVMSIVVEVPKTLFGTVNNNTLNVWAEAKTKM